jgi:CarD family transcriptional regulator
MDSMPASSAPPAASRQEGWSKTRHGFNTDDFVVYPAHGVGQILAIEEQVVAGANLEFFVIYFAKSKMTLRAPTRKAIAVGMRQLSDESAIERARRTLSQPSRKLRGNWTRVAQEYESKLKSGDIVAVAEVMIFISPPLTHAKAITNGSCTRSHAIACPEKLLWLTASPMRQPSESWRA